jgi:peptide/nickel transport system permease protein
VSEALSSPAPVRRTGRLRAGFAGLRLPLHDPLAVVGLAIYAVFILVAIFAPWIATHDPNEILFTSDFQLAADLRPGEDGFLMGTTSLGRDLFSQLVWGARSALLIGLTAAFMVALIGSIVGIVAGYFGGWVDTILMRAADIAFGIPFLPFVIVLAAFLEPSIWNVVIAMALVLWRDTGRVIRSQTLTLRNRAYVEAARVLGSSDLKIILRHIAPNVLPISFLYGSIVVGWAIFDRSDDQLPRLRRPDSCQLGLHAPGRLREPGAVEGQPTTGSCRRASCIMLIVSAGFFISRGYEEDALFPKLRD